MKVGQIYKKLGEDKEYPILLSFRSSVESFTMKPGANIGKINFRQWMQTKKTSHLLNQNKSKRWEYYKILKNFRSYSSSIRISKI